MKEVNLLRERVWSWSVQHVKGSSFTVLLWELQHATNVFDNSFKIGEGGYGRVFKGSLHGMIVAIKLLNRAWKR
jgi:hypothetical protein